MPKGIIAGNIPVSGNTDWNLLTGFGINLEANKSYEIIGLIGVTTEDNPSYGQFNLQAKYSGTTSVKVANQVEEIKFNQNNFIEGLFTDNVGVFTTNRTHETWAKIGGIIRTTSNGAVTLEGKVSNAAIKGILTKKPLIFIQKCLAPPPPGRVISA